MLSLKWKKIIKFRSVLDISNQAVVKLDYSKNTNIGIPDFLHNTNRKTLISNRVIWILILFWQQYAL